MSENQLTTRELWLCGMCEQLIDLVERLLEPQERAAGIEHRPKLTLICGNKDA